MFQLSGFASAKDFDHTTVQTFGGACRWIAPEVCVFGGIHCCLCITETFLTENAND